MLEIMPYMLLWTKRKKNKRNSELQLRVKPAIADPNPKLRKFNMCVKHIWK